LPELTLKNEKFYRCGRVFFGKAPYHINKDISVRAYFVEAFGDISPGAEITDSAWTKSPTEYDLSDVTRQIITLLQKSYHVLQS